MRNCQSVMPKSEGEEHVFAAAQHILKALGTSKNLSDSFRKVLTELDRHLSSISTRAERESTGLTEVEERLRRAERKIMHWESKVSRIWDLENTEASSEYLQAVNEILSVMESLGSFSIIESGNRRELLHQAQCALQIAMSRLEEQLYHLLLQHKQSVEPEYTSFHSHKDDVIYDESFNSTEHEIVEEITGRASNGREDIESAVDMIDPQVLPSIKSIANIMFASRHVQEFCEVFIHSRQDALNEYLDSLEMENLSIEDVLKLDWNCLNSKIKKWMWAMKNFISGYLASENRFCNQLLGHYGYVNSYCFIEISKASVLRLLNFGQAVAMGSHRPEKIKRLLDMYDVLENLQLHIDTFFSEDAGSLVRIEFHELMEVLGNSAKMAFLEFRNAIASDESVHPLPGGGIHPLTRYVMNYLTILVDYSATLNLLLRDVNVDHPNLSFEMENGQGTASSTFSTMACHFCSMTSTLESNLAKKSLLYHDESLQHIFMMNNVHYMVQKVKNSDLMLFFGDEWIRKHNGKFQQHATSYQRAAWSSVVSLLKDDKKTPIKERCRRFCNAFDDVYKVQTHWCIPDPKLRDDIQISISKNVVPAYRTFLGVNKDGVSDKHIKYSAESVGKMLLNLFECPPIPKRNSQRR